MIRRLSLFPSIALFSTILSLAACSDGRTPVMVYSPHGRDLLVLFENAFEARHPEIDVRWLDMGSQEVYDRIRSEKANPQCDVWFGGPDAIFARGARDGLLAPYRPSWADAVPESSRGADDLYFGAFRTLPVLVYNEKLVTAGEAPKDWDDLLLPRFRGHVLIRDPIASGVMRTIFGMLLAKSETETGSTARGFEWLLRLDSQTKEYVANPALLHEKLMRGEGEATMWELTDILLERAKGVPFGYRFATSGTPVIDDAIALAAHAPHRAAALEFIEFAGSVEAQALAADKAFRIPARTDIPREKLPAWAQEVLAVMRPAEYDENRAAAMGQEWMAQWDRTVRGKGTPTRDLPPAPSAPAQTP
ncbi:MAG: extracellular solute-binding protein [Thermoanaerobaculia bacterium]